MARGMSTATVRSFRAAAKRVQRAAVKLGRMLPTGLLEIGEEIMTDVKSSRAGKGVPVRHGVLRSTGRTTLLSSNKPKVELSFGGAAAPYALIQHEVMSYRHTVGEPRYLVRGVERWQPGGSPAMRALAQNANEALGGA